MTFRQVPAVSFHLEMDGLHPATVVRRHRQGCRLRLEGTETQDASFVVTSRQATEVVLGGHLAIIPVVAAAERLLLRRVCGHRPRRELSCSRCCRLLQVEALPPYRNGSTRSGTPVQLPRT